MVGRLVLVLNSDIEGSQELGDGLGDEEANKGGVTMRTPQVQAVSVRSKVEMWGLVLATPGASLSTGQELRLVQKIGTWTDRARAVTIVK